MKARMCITITEAVKIKYKEKCDKEGFNMSKKIEQLILSWI